MPVRRLLRLGGEHPAFHVFVAVLDAARAVELLVSHAGPDTRECRAEFERGAGSVRVDGPVHEGVGLILGQLLPVSLGNRRDELVGIEGGNRRHRKNLTVIGV